jgi:hypothetical protein
MHTLVAIIQHRHTLVAIIQYIILTYIYIEDYLDLVYKYTYIYISYSDLLLPISHSL